MPIKSKAGRGILSQQKIADKIAQKVVAHAEEISLRVEQRATKAALNLVESARGKANGKAKVIYYLVGLIIAICGWIYIYNLNRVDMKLDDLTKLVQANAQQTAVLIEQMKNLTVK